VSTVRFRIVIEPVDDPEARVIIGEGTVKEEVIHKWEEARREYEEESETV